MSDPGSADERGDDRDRTDDDALADAIFAMYTSSIPVVPDAEATPADAAPARGDAAAPGLEHAPEPSVESESEPPPAPESPVASEPASAAESAPVASPQPAPSSQPVAESAIDPEPTTLPRSDEASGPRVWDLDEDAEPPSKIWDLGDVPPSIPFDVPSVGVPDPAERPPVVEGEGWTRLVEPESEAGAEPPSESTAAPAEPAWAPPVWEPERMTPPESADEPVADDSPFSVYSDAGVDPAVLERMQQDLSGPIAAAAAPEQEVAEALPPDASTARRQPTPWFDLASAPPPDPSTSVPPAPSPDDQPSVDTAFPPPSPPPLVEPPAGEPVQPEFAGTPDPAPERVAPPVIAEPPPVTDPAPADPLPTIASLPDDTVRSSPLPPSLADAPPPRPDDGATDEPASDAGSATAAIGPEHLPPAGRVERAGLEPTPEEQRAGRSGRLFWLWFAPTGSILAAGAGAVLFSTGMSLRQTIIATLLGVAISFLPLGVVAFAARGSGQPTLVTSRATFGVVGNVLPALLALVTRAAIGGILLWFAGQAVRVALARFSVPSVSAVIAVGVVGVLAAVFAAIGYGLLSRALFVLAAITGVLGAGLITLTASRIDLTAALGVPDGSWILLIGGAVVVLSLVGLAWAQSGGDVARYQLRTGSGSATVVSASAGAAVPALVLAGWGALLAASSPALARGLGTDPVGAVVGLIPVWATLPFLGLVVVSSVAGAAIACYSGGFAVLATGVRMPRPAASVVAGVLLVAAGIGLTAAGISTRAVLADLLPTLAVPVAAWIGILGAETMIRRRRLHAPSLLARGGVYPAVRVVNVLALVVASALGWGFSTSSLAGLAWQGWAFPLVGVSSTSPLAQSHLGVLIALGFGLLVPVVAAIRTIRKQEAVRADAAGAPTARIRATTPAGPTT